MQVLTLTGTIDSVGHLQLDISTYLPVAKVEIVLVINAIFPEKHKRRYDFSSLTGKLSLQGEPVAIAKEMRNAW